MVWCFRVSKNFSFDFSQVSGSRSERGLTDPVPVVVEDPSSVPVEVMLDTMFDIFMARFDLLDAALEELKNGRS